MAWKIIPHTSDIGVEVKAPSRRELFRQAGLALSSLFVEGHVLRRAKRKIEVTAQDDESLLVNFLNEIIFLFDKERFIPGEILIKKLGKKALLAELEGEHFSSKRHQPNMIVKAATYHQLLIKKEGRTWSARLIFDV